MPLLLDIINWAKRDWNSISASCQVRKINNRKGHLQLLCALDAWCDPAFIGPDEMGEVVDDIVTIFDRYHWTV